MTNKFFRDVSDYLERHLEDDLSVSRLAERYHYSRFHFHRLFLNEMGMSSSRYIKQRRLIRASYELMLSDTSITDLAYDIGYKNLDTFIRNFKDLYGMTPSEYRKNSWKKESEDQMINGLELKRLSLDGYKACFEYIDCILNLSKIAHEKGLLSLEKVTIKSIFLNEGIKLLLDGTPPNTLREILYNYIKSSDLNDLESYERVIYTEGLLMIQAGSFPWVIRKYMASYLGEEMIDIFKTYYEDKLDYQTLEDTYIKHQSNNKGIALEKTLVSFNSRQLQRLIRECNDLSLLIASENFSQASKDLLISAMSKGRKYTFLELMDLLKYDVSEANLIDAQQTIKKTINKLRLDGDI